jgi:3-isopropylmalate/(R)-2-methylmalate dehydratase small subunit
MKNIWIFGDDINTDEIIPGRYNVTTDPDELKKHVFCEIKPDLTEKMLEGDIIIAGRNFGCGSSREHAVIAIAARKPKVIIAKSFARIFFRNAVNLGLPIIECPELPNSAIQGSSKPNIEVNYETGTISINDEDYQGIPMPRFILQIIESDGIINFLKNNDLEALDLL